MAFGRRFSGMGTPALAHMAAALALAISSNWSLSEQKRQKTRVRKFRKMNHNGNDI